MARQSTLTVAVLAAASLGLSVPAARAADDGYKDVFSSVLGAVGLMPNDASPDIEYRERAPLVIPPKMALVKPVESTTGRSAAWPKDPDVLKRRKASEQARAPMPNLLGNASVVASKDELGRNRLQGGESGGVPEISQRQSQCGNNGNQRNCLVVSPDELARLNEQYKASGQGEKTEIAVGVEPERFYLTQPPKGYLRVSRDVKATTEAPKQKIDPSNPNADLIYREKTDE